MAGSFVVAALTASCSTSVDKAVEAPSAQARTLVDQAAVGFRDTFRTSPGRVGVDRTSARLGAQDSGSTQMVVLSSTATPSHGEIALAVYIQTDGARDGDPFGQWTVRMCVRLIADGTSEVTVHVESLKCPQISDPPFPEVDATVEYRE